MISYRRASSALAGFAQGVVLVPTEETLGIPSGPGSIIELGKASRLEELVVDIIWLSGCFIKRGASGMVLIIVAPCNATSPPPHLRNLPILIKPPWRLAAMLIDVRKSIVSGRICLVDS
jgi:hypothetical protein